MFGLLLRLFKLSIKIGFVVAGIAIVVAYARLSEYGDMRTQLMKQIENSYAGRLVVDGPAELNLSFPPSITIQNVRLKNSKWASRPDMMTAERVVAEVDLLPLIQGEMALPRLRMIGVDIVVEVRGDGSTNWDELNDFETAAGPGGPSFPLIIPQIAGTTVSVAGGSLTVVGSGTETAAASGGAATTTVSLGGGVIEGGGHGLVPCL